MSFRRRTYPEVSDHLLNRLLGGVSAEAHAYPPPKSARLPRRGVPIEQCMGSANAGEADVVRYIITCTSVCTPQQGDVRIDIVGSNGTVRSAGDGSYASAPAAAPLPSDPGPS